VATSASLQNPPTTPESLFSNASRLLEKKARWDLGMPIQDQHSLTPPLTKC